MNIQTALETNEINMAKRPKRIGNMNEKQMDKENIQVEVDCTETLENTPLLLTS